MPFTAQGPLKGPRSSRVLDAFSCYSRLILKHSDTKMGYKKKVDQMGEGHVPVALPPGSTTEN